MQDEQSNSVSVGGLPDLQRRKAILKGLGKTAVVATAAPLSTLAHAKLRYVDGGQNLQCSVSGQMSVLTSHVHASVTQCRGSTGPDYGSYVPCKAGDSTAADWGSGKVADQDKDKPVLKDNWPNWPNDGTKATTTCSDGRARTPRARFSAIFGGGSGTRVGRLLLDSPSSDEAQWLTALLNAQKHASVWPHTPTDVLAHYANAAKRDAALAFYKKINKPASQQV